MSLKVDPICIFESRTYMPGKEERQISNNPISKLLAVQNHKVMINQVLRTSQISENPLMMADQGNEITADKSEQLKNEQIFKSKRSRSNKKKTSIAKAKRLTRKKSTTKQKRAEGTEKFRQTKAKTAKSENSIDILKNRKKKAASPPSSQEYDSISISSTNTKNRNKHSKAMLSKNRKNSTSGVEELKQDAKSFKAVSSAAKDDTKRCDRKDLKAINICERDVMKTNVNSKTYHRSRSPLNINSIQNNQKVTHSTNNRVNKRSKYPIESRKYFGDKIEAWSKDASKIFKGLAEVPPDTIKCYSPELCCCPIQQQQNQSSSKAPSKNRRVNMDKIPTRPRRLLPKENNNHEASIEQIRRKMKIPSPKENVILPNLKRDLRSAHKAKYCKTQYPHTVIAPSKRQNPKKVTRVAATKKVRRASTSRTKRGSKSIRNKNKGRKFLKRSGSKRKNKDN